MTRISINFSEYENNTTVKRQDSSTNQSYGSIMSNMETSSSNKSNNVLTEDNEKSSTKQRYKLGKRNGNVRTIGEDSVVGGGSYHSSTTIHIGNQTFNLPNSNPNPYEHTMDGFIGDSAQNQRGDCYFLAELNAIRNTAGGQALLKKNCKKNINGSYTVTLPGAQKIRDEYIKKGLKCEITGTYNISKDALLKAGTSKFYSKGDLEVVAFELAMEAYRAEMVKTKELNHDRSNNFRTAQGEVSGRTDADYLSSGFGFDAGYILTGKKSDVYMGTNENYNKVKPYKDGQYGYITREEMNRPTNKKTSVNKGVSTNEISHLTSNKNDVDKMLSKYAGKEDQFAITFGVRVAKNGPDGHTKAGGGHEITVVKITDDIVYVSNPWHPDKIEPIPRNEFIKMTTTLTAMPVENNAPHQQNPLRLTTQAMQLLQQHYKN